MATRWYRDRKRDFYYRKAKEKGYRARSAFKLLQIQQRYGILRKGNKVLDLGAAPGGWCQVAKEFVGKEGLVVGIDILPIKPIDGVYFIKGDVTDIETKSKVKKIIGKSKFDAVISDMSPNISGNYSLDQARSVWLCEQALDYAKEFLKRGGNFLCKVFEGEDFPHLRRKIEESFQRIENVVPKASRKTSSEIYIIGFSYCPN